MVRVLGFALRPDFLGASGIVLIRQDEIKPCGGLAFVAQVHFKNFAGFRGLREAHAEACCREG